MRRRAGGDRERRATPKRATPKRGRPKVASAGAARPSKVPPKKKPPAIRPPPAAAPLRAELTGDARAAEEQRAEAELLRRIVDVDPGALAVIAGEDLRYVLANAAYRALVPDGADPTGRRFEDVWPATTRGPELRALMARGEAKTYPLIPISVRGQPRAFAVHVRPVAGSRAPALFIACWDHTELLEMRRRAEEGEQLARRRAAELDAVFESMASGVVFYDGDGRVVRMNDAAARMWRPSADELHTDRLRTMRVERSRGVPLPAEELPVFQALRGGVVRGVEMLLTADPARPGVWLNASAAPLRLPDGTQTGVVVTFADTTALHAAQEQREDFIRTLTHDVRTPLSVILNQAELLRRRTADEAEVARRADTIATSTKRVAGMLRDLVETAQLETGGVAVRASTFPFGRFAADLLDRLRGTLEVDRVRLAPDLDPASEVHADPDRLERVLVNLISNALKYSPPGEHVVLDGAPADRQFVVSVADRGPGVAAEDLPYIFGRFYRSQTHRDVPGMGLGLYIARMLVEAHGGRLTVEPTPGGGATFRAALPFPPE
jgi:two-component system, OmpR family, phosphate regulon sensor histidine kinase PhoR